MMDLESVFRLLKRDCRELTKGRQEDLEILLHLKRSRQQLVYNGEYDGTMLNEEVEVSSVAMSSEGTPEEIPPMPPDSDWPDGVVWLTDNEKKIWSVIARDRWMTTQEISEKTGIPNDKELGFILRHLCERKFLESAVGRGYRRRVTPRLAGN